jgi:tetratricopeptide (TPR) repeat protein
VIDALSRALRLSDLVSQARIHDSLAWLSEREQRPADALRHAQESFDLFSAAGSRPGQAMALSDIGYCHALLGQYAEAIACCERSVGLWRELADRFNEADTLDQLGNVQRSAGDLGAARQTWTRAVRIFDEIDHPDGEQVRSPATTVVIPPRPGTCSGSSGWRSYRRPAGRWSSGRRPRLCCPSAAPGCNRCRPRPGRSDSGTAPARASGGPPVARSPSSP